MELDEKWRDYMMLIPAGAIYFGLWPFTGEGKAFAAAVVFGVFYVVISRNWDRRRDWKFWTIIAFFGVAHLIGLSTINIPHLSAGLIALPFALVDGLIMYNVISWIERRFSN